MREDMAKIIVERPRLRGGRDKGGRRGNLDFEDLPSRESMLRAHRDRKTLNENLAPLRRFLESSAGRPWDRVFSEICERIDVKSAVQLHIRQHVFDFVARHVFERDGKLFVRSFWRDDVPLEDSYHKLYIHPGDGLLKKVKRPKNWIRPGRRWMESNDRSDTRADGPPGVQFHKRHGIWYRVEMQPIPAPVSYWATYPDGKRSEHATADGLRRDVLLGETLYVLLSERPIQRGLGWHTSANRLKDLYGKDGIYGASMKQANSKELKMAGLKNDPARV